MIYTLSDLGWSAFFSMQLDVEDLESFAPMRISEVQRATVTALSEKDVATLTTPPDMTTADLAVGDWVLADSNNRIVRCLERRTVLERRAAGTDVQNQLIAANVDTLFVTTSCNDDFNEARLERYLVLAHDAGIQPVMVLTKADLASDPDSYIRRAQSLSADMPVIALNAKDPEDVTQLFDWWRKGQTAVLLGSSGVGKSTLTNMLAGADISTAGIRDDDSKGRHTTTARSLYPVSNGGWLIDTPGMRALRLHSVSEGISSVFADLEELAQNCRFRDCSHGKEPGCAIQKAIAEGVLDAARLQRWQKLEEEDARNEETIAESRKRQRDFKRMTKCIITESKTRKGR